jgi:hypothetical protein
MPVISDQHICSPLETIRHYEPRSLALLCRYDTTDAAVAVIAMRTRAAGVAAVAVGFAASVHNALRDVARRARRSVTASAFALSCATKSQPNVQKGLA